MATVFYILIFLGSCAILTFSSRSLVGSLSRIAKFLGWKEFVVGFFIMAMATSFPNLFIGIISAINKVPELSFGDVVGANIFDLSVVMALAAFVSRRGLAAQSKTVQGSAFFTMATAILPLLLVIDGNISRPDGIILIAAFIFYVFWIFSKKDRFEKIYDAEEKIRLKFFLKNIGIFIISVAFLLLAAEGFVKSAMFFADTLNISVALVGMLIIGVGSSLPETFFSLHAARHGHDWLLLGDLMGGVIIVSTLVLGIVALIYPIEINDFAPFAIARIFLIIAAVSFLFFIKTGQKISKKESVFLILIYIVFLIVIISTQCLKNQVSASC